jgi:DNA-binding Lrp family transcriptional regulator
MAWARTSSPIRCEEGDDPLRLDELDQRIVAWLSRDARASYRTIGDAIGLSAPAVKRRVDRLLDQGVIERFSAVLDPRALGWSTEAFIELFCEGRTPPAVIRTTLARYPEVVGAYTITGDPDALVHVRAADTPHLEATLERIRSEPYVTRTRSVLVLSRLLEREIRPTDRPPSG